MMRRQSTLRPFIPNLMERFGLVLFLCAHLVVLSFSATAIATTQHIDSDNINFDNINAEGSNTKEIELVTEETRDAVFKAALNKLNQKNFTQKTLAIAEFSALEDSRILTSLIALLDSKLFYVKKTKEIGYAKKRDSLYVLTDPVTTTIIGKFTKRKVKKISLNNRLRTLIRQTIAGLQLTSQDRGIRLQAATSIIKKPSKDLMNTLKKAIEVEKDGEVLKQLTKAKAVINIGNPSAAIRMDAVHQLEGSLSPEIRSLLNSLLIVEDDGSFREPEESVRTAAEAALKTINDQVQVYKFAENLFFGISLGSVLLLSAVGLAITFGVMGVINMAHGEMMMIGAYTTYVVQLLMPNHIEYSLFVAIPAAFFVAGAMGIIIERVIIRHLYGRPLETLLATFGLSLILQQLVRSIFSPLNRSVYTPDWMSGSWAINDALSLTYNRLYIIFFALAVLMALILLLKKTRFGLQMRAVTQNRSMARAIGIRTNWVDAMTFGLGSGIAGIAGVALSQLTNVGPNLGQAYIIDSFMVVVFGGVGNLFGTFFAAMSLGIANKFVEPYAGAVLAKIFILVFIIIFIQRRPRGLFALKGRAAEE